MSINLTSQDTYKLYKLEKKNMLEKYFYKMYIFTVHTTRMYVVS